jgi:hypothetical protein
MKLSNASLYFGLALRNNHWEACIGKQEQGVWQSVVGIVNQILTLRCCGVYAIGVRLQSDMCPSGNVSLHSSPVLKSRY